jgi:PAS domain S-box-containing protein
MNSQYSILILEDDDAQVELVSEYLRVHLGCKVDAAYTGKQFWQLLEKNDYSVIFMDYRLPDTNGLETLREISRRHIRIPVVMITGEGNEMVAARSIQEGALDYLVKGQYPISRLATVVEKAVSTRKLQDAVIDSVAKIRYQSILLDNVRDAVVVWDASGKITFWNPAAFLLFGIKPDEAIGKSVNSIYLNAFNPPIQIPAMGDTSGLEIERQFINAKGQMRWISSRVSVLRDDEKPGQLLGYIDVSRDISRRRREQQALRESEARYRAIVEDHQTEYIFRSLADTTLTFVNEVFCQYLHKSRAELIGTQFLDYVYDDDRLLLQSHLSSLGRGKIVFTCEYRIYLPNGAIRWNEATHRAIFDDQNNYIEFQSVGRDITRRKEMEAQIQQSQMHLVQSARLSSIGQLAAGVAHQIYNPLTTVIGESQILMQQFGEDHPASESLKAIVAAGWRSQQVVQQLMEYSQPSLETMKCVQINQTVQQAILLVGLDAPVANVRLELGLSEELPPITCNAHQMEDLWVNLLLLAKASIRDDSHHTIRIISHISREAEVVVEICDDGEPVPAARLDSIFEPSLEPVGGRGNGMELSICREIVRQNGGNISVQSDQNGTRVKVTLPIEGTTYS